MNRRFLGLAAVFVMLLGPVLAVPVEAAESIERCNGLEATIVGTDGNDTIVGTSAADVIVALGGDDVIDGANGNDVICGGTGADEILGGNGIDRIDGGADDDVLRGGNGNDTLLGGAGDDTLLGGRGDDDLNGNRGEDSSDGGRGDDTCRASEIVSLCEEVITGELVETVVNDDVVDTTPEGTEDGLSTGSFFLGGSVPVGATSITVSVSGEELPAIVANGRWIVELVPPSSGEYQFTVVASGAGDEIESVVLNLTVVAHDDDDILFTPEFRAGERLELTAVDYDPQAGRLVFDGENVADNIWPGMVLKSDPTEVAPDGYLRVVETVQAGDGQTIVTGRPGTLLDIFRQLQLEHSVGNDLDDVVNPSVGDESSGSAGGGSEPGGGGLSGPWTTPSAAALLAQQAATTTAAVAAAGDSTPPIFDAIPSTAQTLELELTEPGATFVAEVGLSIDPDIDIDIDWCNGWACLGGPSLDYFLFEVHSIGYAEANLRGEQQVTLGSLERELVSVRIGTIQAGPVNITVTAEATGFMEATYTGVVEAWVQAKISAGGGFEYDDDGTGRGVFSTGPDTERAYAFTTYGVIDASVSVDFAVKFKLYDVVGPEVVVSPGLGAAAIAGFEFTSEVSGRAFVGVEVTAFIELAVGLDTEILGIGDDIIPLGRQVLYDRAILLFSLEKEWFIDLCDPDPLVVLAGVVVPIPGTGVCADGGELRRIKARLGAANEFTEIYRGQVSNPGIGSDATIEKAAKACVDVAQRIIDSGVNGSVTDLCVDGVVFYSGFDGQGQVTNHIRSALVQNIDWALLRYRDRSTTSRDAWYYKLGPNAACQKVDDRVPAGKNCDEYPFFSSNKGYNGTLPYPSTMMIDRSDNSSHGGSFGQFLRQCPGVKTSSQAQFLVVPLPDTTEFSGTKSLWTCQGRSGVGSGVGTAIVVDVELDSGPTIGETATAVVTVLNPEADNTSTQFDVYVPVPEGVKDPADFVGADCSVQDRELICEVTVADGLAGGAALDFTVDFTVCDRSIEDGELVDPDCSDGSGRLGSDGPDGGTEADLDLAVDRSPFDGIQPGEVIVFSHILTNLGPDDATSTQLTVELPEGVSQVTFPSECAEDPVLVVTCEIGSLAAGDQRTLPISARLAIDANPAVMSITSTALAIEYDPNGSTVKVPFLYEPVNLVGVEPTDFIAESTDPWEMQPIADVENGDLLIHSVLTFPFDFQNPATAELYSPLHPEATDHVSYYVDAGVVGVASVLYDGDPRSWQYSSPDGDPVSISAAWRAAGEPTHFALKESDLQGFSGPSRFPEARIAVPGSVVVYGISFIGFCGGDASGERVEYDIDGLTFVGRPLYDYCVNVWVSDPIEEVGVVPGPPISYLGGGFRAEWALVIPPTTVN